MKLPAAENIEIMVRDCTTGDEAAFQKLYSALNDPLFRYILTRTKDRDDTFDILQDVFIDLWKGLQNFTYRSDGQFYSFVFTITKRKLSKHYSKVERHALILERHDTEELYEEISVEERDDLRVTIEAVGRLKDKYREVVELRYWSDLPFADIAKLLGTKETTVKVRHHRALKKLEQIVQEYET